MKPGVNQIKDYINIGLIRKEIYINPLDNVIKNSLSFMKETDIKQYRLEKYVIK